MRGRYSASFALAAFGILLLVAASLANAAPAVRKGGTMRLNMSSTDVDFSDPSLAYGAISWQIEYSTALKAFSEKEKIPYADQFHALVDVCSKLFDRNAA